MCPVLKPVAPLRLLEEMVQDWQIESDPVARLRGAAAFFSDLSSFVQSLTLGQESDLVRASSVSPYTAGAGEADDPTWLQGAGISRGISLRGEPWSGSRWRPRPIPVTIRRRSAGFFTSE